MCNCWYLLSICEGIIVGGIIAVILIRVFSIFVFKTNIFKMTSLKNVFIVSNDLHNFCTLLFVL